MQNTHSQIIQKLTEIGLNPTDAQIYVETLTMGACTVIHIADQLGMNRVTVHDAVQRLIDKWLFLETHSGQRRLVYPKQVEALQYIVDHKKSELTQLQHQVEQTISLLNNMQLQSTHLPQIRFYKWREGIQTVTHEMLADNQKICMLSDSWHFDDLIDNKFIEQASNHPHYKQLIQLIIPVGYEHFSFTHKARHSTVEIKQFWPDQHRSWGMAVWWDKVAYYSYEWRYITTTIIQNKAISMMMRAAFASLRWQSYT